MYPHFLSPLRVIWRATFAVVGWLTLRLLTLWSSSDWHVTLPRGFCNSTNTTSYTGAVCQSLQLYLPPSPCMFLLKKENWMHCVPPAGLSLQQHPGAAWVIVTNSSISDFVAGGEPLSLSLSSHVVAAIATRQGLPGKRAQCVWRRWD